MKILQRYYISEFFKILGILAFGLAMIFSLLDLIDKIDNFIPGKLSFIGFIHYAVLNLPKYLYYLLPMSLLICSLFIFSQAARYKEITVIKATGGRLTRLFYPFIILGILLSLFGFVLGEFVMPDFSDRTIEFKRTFMKGGDKYAFKEGTLWLRGTNGAFIRIELYIPDKKLAKGISIFLTEQSSLKNRIEAEEALWIGKEGSEGIWKLRGVIIYDVEKGTVNKLHETDYPYLESPDLFRKEIKGPQEMGIGELYRYAKRLKAAGFQDTNLIVDLNSKVSYPLTNFIMIMLGMSFSVMGRIGGGLIAAGVGIAISFVYWLTYTLMLSLGYARIIPPIAAGWVVPVIFGAIAFYLFKKIPE